MKKREKKGDKTTEKPDVKTDRETVRIRRRNGLKTPLKTRLTMSSYTRKRNVKEALRVNGKGRYETIFSNDSKPLNRALMVERFFAKS